jgi:hypothetical protein
VAKVPFSSTLIPDVDTGRWGFRLMSTWNTAGESKMEGVPLALDVMLLAIHISVIGWFVTFT